MRKKKSLTAFERLAAVIEDIEEQRPQPDERRARGRETYAAIVSAAREVYVAEGHAGLSIGKVSDRCGVNKGNIAYYFPTKTDLLNAVLLEELCHYLRSHLVIAEAGDVSPVGALEEVVDFYFRATRLNHRFFLQTYGFVASNAFAREFVSDLYASIIDFLATLVQAVRPELTKVRAKTAAVEIMSAVEGATVLYGIGLVREPVMRKLQSTTKSQVAAIVQRA